MAHRSRTLDQWVARAIANFRTSFRGWPLGDKTFLGRSARALSLVGWGLDKAMEEIDADIVPSAKSSEDALDAWAFELGLPDGDGGFGRLKPTIATGGEAALTGVKGTVYPDGATATAEDGTTVIELSGSVTIPGSPPGFGTIDGVFVAVTPGMAGNLAEGTRCTWDSPPAGADSTFTITSAMLGGTDRESNAAVFARIVSRLQTPPRGGVSEDYRQWTTEVDGITAWVYPKRSGTGTVDVVITQNGTGKGRAPSEDQRLEVEASILAKRPVAVEGVSVIIPQAADGDGHVVRVRVVPSAGKEFDWIDTAASYTVDAYSAGPPATLRFNGQLAPATLKAAIDAFVAGTGDAPRLQVISTGSVINPPIRAVAWSDGGGETTLELESLPDGWVPPTAGDKVFAYGPVVETIASGVLALADSLGPSRASGFGDEITPWKDTLTISGIIAVAEQAIDTDGSELIEKVPVGFATIDGAVLDVQPVDTGTPELLYLESIAVTQ